MTGRHRPPAVLHYELRVAGHLDDHWSSWFSGMALTREADGTTALRGAVVDEAALHGLLAKVRDLGVPLLSLTRFDGDGPEAAVLPDEGGDGVRPRSEGGGGG